MAIKIPTSCGCFIVLVMVGMIAAYTCSKMDSGPRRADTPKGPKYETAWRQDLHIGISKALVAKGIMSCGQYKYKRDLNVGTEDAGEFLVHCTSDGEKWVAYLVWPAIGEVTGPFEPDPANR